MYLCGSKPHSYCPVVCKRCNEPLSMYDYEESLEDQKLEKTEEEPKLIIGDKMKDINQIKIVITKFNEERVVISVYSEQNGKYITRNGKSFDKLDLDLFYSLNKNKNKVFQLVTSIVDNNHELVFNGKPQLHVLNVYYDKLLLKKDLKLYGVVFKIKDKHKVKEYNENYW